MNSQAPDNDTVREGSVASKVALSGDYFDEPEKDMPEPAIAARLPGIGWMYRTLEDWQAEFSPRNYQQRANQVSTRGHRSNLRTPGL